MKTLILSLSLLLFGCASTSGFVSEPLAYATLATVNRSGGTVRLFMSQAGDVIRLGRVWPGKDCFVLRQAREYAPAFFGIEHLLQGVVWSPTPAYIDPTHGWSLEINQPQQAVFDLLAMTPAEKC